ncbi:DUF6912 family protein [Nocardioides cynanchi]|uniref:DUF6912 family protein n=1 Tax=Nocardioides cynanchi TaxID=2558918 RepID=UPI0012445BE5|nr:hypothetical protein [Nocardioides cynanchi]
MTRLYVPATLVSLAELDAGSMLDSAEAFVAADESEEAEYDALVAAAEASAALVAGLGGGLRRRVVVVAEVDDEPQTIGIRDVVAVHADPVDLGPGGADPDDDLGWYATQEIADLLAGG